MFKNHETLLCKSGRKKTKRKSQNLGYIARIKTNVESVRCIKGRHTRSFNGCRFRGQLYYHWQKISSNCDPTSSTTSPIQKLTRSTAIHYKAVELQKPKMSDQDIVRYKQSTPEPTTLGATPPEFERHKQTKKERSNRDKNAETSQSQE